MTLPELKDEVLDFIDLNKINVDSDILTNFVMEHRLKALEEHFYPLPKFPLKAAKRLTKDIMEHQND